MPGISQSKFLDLGVGIWVMQPEDLTFQGATNGPVFYHKCKRVDRSKGRLTYTGELPTIGLKCRHCHSRVELKQWLVACAYWSSYVDHTDPGL